MIEVGAPEARGTDPAAAAAQAQTAGAMLRNAREAAGLHVAALAVAMKVPVAKLDALENDRHDLLPDAVFARALAASVCRTLKIDAAPVLARLPQTGKPRLVQDTDGLNAPFRSPRDTVSSHWKDQLTRPVALIVGALLVGALVVLLLPRHPDEGAPVAGTSSTEAAATASPTAPAAGRETAAPAPAAVTAPAEVMTASVAMAPPAAAAAPPAPAVPAASAAASTAAAAASAPAAPVATGVIVFRASAQSWIEVRDAKGAVPVRKLLSTGETAGASGAMPLQVTVGNAGATEVQVRGKPFDLRAITRDNVARFEVK
ncbi:helix-turn-helix domain-containing protein [Ramlibacter sp. RBP-2]|uniref:Helix-turn-helix domain-containing protein n=1 Tax=Ramlibacter lithotrophicus TaxID=2606681 RepID=A0A7X6I4J0_9BURK|nr:helix-turn-helix domain-containing protein [Ramlibacter lithotrophicus]NKE64361.1 helix-turn-helix domain-containing protein [Ramlibacter lithotrophicus]